MTITGHLKPRPQRPAAPAPVYDQDAKRERRRQWLPVVLDGNFSLTDEIDAILRPVAAKLGAEPCPGTYIGSVSAVSDAVQELCDRVGDIVNEARVSRVGSADRRRARDALRTLTTKPAPEITRIALVEGQWAQPLAALAQPLSASLSGLLGRQADERRGAATVSDEIVDTLRALDRAVLDLDRRIDRARNYRAQNPHAVRPNGTDTDEQAARATLAELGIDDTLEQEKA